MTYPIDTLSLVADVGGTNTRVALADGRALLSDSVKRYKNAEFPGLETVLRRYVEDAGGVDCRAAAVAVAGPVRDGRGVLTNLDWSIDSDTLARASQAETVAVLNDLQAQGHALGHIAEENLRQVVEGAAAPETASRLVIGVGTGFNAAPVFEATGGRYVPPSESGHVNMPIRTDAELRLCKFVETAHGFPAIEDVLSGRGLERVYAWVASEAGTPAELSAAQIMERCNTDTDPLARDAVQQFVRTLGTVAGNLALIQLPFGGVYLIGGVTRAMAPHFADFGFEASFRDKGRFSGFMQNFPVYIVEDDFAALTGLATHLTDLL